MSPEIEFDPQSDRFVVGDPYLQMKQSKSACTIFKIVVVGGRKISERLMTPPPPAPIILDIRIRVALAK